MNNSPSFIVDKIKNIKLGSGHLFFDINAPLNNTPWDYNKEKYTEIKNLKKEHLFEASSMFALSHRSIEAYPVLRPIVESILNSSDEKYLLTTRVNANGGCLDSYQNNRDNMLHWLAGMSKISEFDTEKREFFKHFVKEIINAGVSPLEKSTRDGYTPLVYAFQNSDMDEDLLTFFASLHPASLTDLTDYKDNSAPLFQLLCMENCSSERFLMAGNLIDIKDIPKNIEAIQTYHLDASFTAPIINLLNTRLINYEKSVISEGVPIASTISVKPLLKI